MAVYLSKMAATMVGSNGKHENFINCSLISGVLTELFKTSLLSSPPSSRKIL